MRSLAKLRGWSSRPPQTDPRNTGVTFVDVLFALVIGKVLDASVAGHVPIAGKAQLALTAVLTVTSWVGYHNSTNRSPYFLRFVNWPLVQFLLDILLVYDYWLCVAFAERAGVVHTDVPNAVPESAIVLAAAVLYLLWDLVAWRVRLVPAYKARPASQDIPARRRASVVLVFVTATLCGLVAWLRPRTTDGVVLVDAALAVVLVLYRLAKEVATPRDALRPMSPQHAAAAGAADTGDGSSTTVREG